ncbi:MAG: hypothetical protein CL610_20835 [Anaerolineaceae bacterium]|nr:hypothetical protein [Anaerolineaceae bacterium]
MDALLKTLLQSDEPAIRYRMLAHVMGCHPDSQDMREARQAIRQSPRIQALLAERDANGRLPYGAYHKWDGPHWVLTMLAEMGYPPGDESLRPLAEQVYSWLFSDKHIKRIKRVTIADRVRMCASMEGNAIYYLLSLGLADDRVNQLVQRLLDWQWPDGGWNCDKRPDVQHTSSFMETLIPLRGLAAYARHTGSAQARVGVEQAAEVFLKRRLYKRVRDGQVMDASFICLHYPCYWHYDILFGLKVMAEAGFITDPRCADALDLLESKRLPDGGFPAEKKYYRVTDQPVSGRSLVDWGGTSQQHLNPFVTTDALIVLKAAGRLPVP